MAAGNQGGGVTQTPGPTSIGYPPFARGANLIAMLERLRAEDWPVDVPVPGSVTNDETSPDAVISWDLD